MKSLKYAWLLVVLLALAACGQDVAPGGELSVLDDVANDVVATGQGSNQVKILRLEIGSSATVKYHIVPTNGDKQNGCNADDGTAATVTPGALPSGVAVNPTSLAFAKCATDSTLNAQEITFRANGSTAIGDSPISVSVNDAGNNGTYNVNTAQFTLRVISPTTTTVTSSLNPSRTGDLVTFTATVAATKSSATPTGTVQFKVDGTNVGSPVNLNASGVATYSTSSLTVGDRSITAEYSGATGTSAATAFGASTSAALMQKVNSATVDTTTTLTSSANPSTYGQSVAFTATVAAASGTTKPTGNVQFRIGGVNAGSPVTLNADGVATYSAPSLSVGSHSVTAEYRGATGFSTSNSSELIQQVNKAQATISLSNLEHTYSGSPKSATATTVPADLTGVSITYDGSATAPMNAGSYAVVARLNHDNYSAPEVTATLVIGKASQTINFGELGSKTFGDPSFEISATGGASGNPVAFSAAGQCRISTANSEITVFIDGAGNCTITASQASNNNYSAAVDVSRSFTIAKATQTITWGTPDAITYGTALGDKQLNASTNRGGALTYDPPAGTVLDAGSHTLNVTAAETSNYKETSATVELVVNKAKATINVSGYEGVYDGEAHGATGTATGVNGKKLSLNLGDSFTNVPGGTANWSFDGDGNYEAASGSVEIKISQAEAKIDVKGYSGVYDGKPHGAAGTATGVKGESLSLDLGDSFTDVPGSTATWSFAGNSNYKSAKGSVEIEITKAATTTTVSCPAGPFTYTGSAQTPCSASVTGAGGLNESLTVSYQDNTNAVTATASASYAESANHLGSSNSTTFTINKADQAISWSNPSAITYGTALGSSQLNASRTEGDGALTYNPGAGTVLNAGTHTLNVEAAETQNYKATSASVKLVVNKAQATVSLSNLAHFWDGSAKSATVTTSPSGLRVATTYNGSSSTPSAVGSYSVVTTISDPNYQGSASGTLTISPWTLKGFYAPVDMGGVVNTVKAGSTVPLKFEIFAASELTNTSAVSSFKTATVGCSTLSTTSDDIEVTTTGGTNLRYDSTAGQFIQNWQTPKTVGCYRATLTTQDGGTLTAYFKTR